MPLLVSDLKLLFVSPKITSSKVSMNLIFKKRSLQTNRAVRANIASRGSLLNVSGRSREIVVKNLLTANAAARRRGPCLLIMDLGTAPR